LGRNIGKVSMVSKLSNSMLNSKIELLIKNG